MIALRIKSTLRLKGVGLGQEARLVIGLSARVKVKRLKTYNITYPRNWHLYLNLWTKNYYFMSLIGALR
jgi:hypothetical protein